jgi:hypothetical protein
VTRPSVPGVRRFGRIRKGVRPPIPGVRRFARIRRGERLLARGALCLALAFFVAVFSGLPADQSTEAQFQTVSSLGRGNGFSIGGTPEADGLLAGLPADGTVNATAQANTGEALASVPFYWAGKVFEAVVPGADVQEERFGQRTLGGFQRSEYFAHLLVGLRSPLLAALCVWLIVLCASRLGLSRTAAIVTGLGFGFGTFLMPFARQPFGSVQATALLLGAFYLILTAREALERGRRPGRHYLVFCGLSLGLAWMSQDNLLFAVGVLVSTMLFVLLGGHRRLRKLRVATAETAGQSTGLRRDLVLFGVPLLLLAAAGAGLNLMRFDALLGRGDVAIGFLAQGPLAPGWAWSDPKALTRLLVAPGGLLVLAPLLVLVPWGWVLSDGRVCRFSRRVILLLSLGVIFGGGLSSAGGQPWTFGPGLLLPCLPFLLLLAAVALEQMRTTARGRLVAMCLLLFGLLSNGGGVFVNHNSYEQLAAELAASSDSQPAHPAMNFAESAPWAHWRILRHRLAGLGEEFSAEEIFFAADDVTLATDPESAKGLEHFTWLDMQRNLGAEFWPIGIALLLLIGQGIRLLLRSTEH